MQVKQYKNIQKERKLRFWLLFGHKKLYYCNKNYMFYQQIKYQEHIMLRLPQQHRRSDCAKKKGTFCVVLPYKCCIFAFR